jgi:hypothetical protein
MSEILWTIGGVDVTQEDDNRIHYVSHAMIDGDGSGPSHGDPDFQSDTTLHHEGRALNADEVPYIVVPPQVRSLARGVVLGSQAQVTRISTASRTMAVVADIGPHGKIGEMSIACAKALGVPSSPTTGGSDAMDFLYEIFPGTPAVVNGVTYELAAEI